MNDKAKVLTIAPEAVVFMKDTLATPLYTGCVYRFGVMGGGCNGFQYQVACIPDNRCDTDTVVKKDGMTILIDSASLQYMKGVTVKYNEEDLTTGLFFDNPNASVSCGCGNSFSV